MLGNSGPPIARMLPAQTHAGVWNSYAVPSNNLQLWSSVWNEDTEPGVCTGLSPSQWMRRAVQLRDQYNFDVRCAPCCVCCAPVRDMVHAVQKYGGLVRDCCHLACMAAITVQVAIRVDSSFTAHDSATALFALLCCSAFSRTPASLRAARPRRTQSSMPSALHTAATCTWSAINREKRSGGATGAMPRHFCLPLMRRSVARSGRVIIAAANIQAPVPTLVPTRGKVKSQQCQALLLLSVLTPCSTPQQLSSVSLCFSPTTYAIIDCPQSWWNCKGKRAHYVNCCCHAGQPAVQQCACAAAAEQALSHPCGEPLAGS